MAATAASIASRPGALLELNRTFAVSVAVVMFIVNFVGFGPTFFLRPFFDVPQIPLYLYLHGVLGTAWFALVVTQALLIANRQFTRHRQLGWFGLGLAGSWGGLFVPIILTVMLGLMAAFVVHDLWTRRRVHLATIFGLVIFLGVPFAFQASGVGPAIVAYRLAHL